MNRLTIRCAVLTLPNSLDPCRGIGIEEGVRCRVALIDTNEVFTAFLRTQALSSEDNAQTGDKNGETDSLRTHFKVRN